MKKKLIAGIMTIVMMAGLLTGCGGEDNSPKEDSTVAENSAESNETQTEPQQADVADATGEDVTIKVATWDYSNTEYYKTIFDALP